MEHLNRRRFLAASSTVLALGFTAPAPAKKEPWFKISLAQWSLHKMLRANQLDPLDFAKYSKETFEIDAVEYVNQFYKGKSTDKAYTREMRRRADDLGVRSVLIMCDGEGNLGDPDAGKRKLAVENHTKWADLAKYLGCHSIRTNAASDAKLPPDEQSKLCADGLRQLTESTAKLELNTIVENHGGLSSNGDWLVATIRRVDHPRCGTLPDFGNFYGYDRYQGVREMMPYAKGVSAKSSEFDEAGFETKTDYKKMMTIVRDADYHDYVGIEYEGSKLSEPDGIRATKKLLERLRSELSK